MISHLRGINRDPHKAEGAHRQGDHQEGDSSTPGEGDSSAREEGLKEAVPVEEGLYKGIIQEVGNQVWGKMLGQFSFLLHYF